MKAISLIVVYVMSFLFVYLMLSLIGVIISHQTFESVTGESGWFMAYTFLIGWWISIFPAREYYIKHKDEFDAFM
jgi:hypothetical protein